MLRGQWLVHYDPDHFAYTDILSLLPNLQKHLETANISAHRKQVILNPVIASPSLTLFDSPLPNRSQTALFKLPSPAHHQNLEPVPVQTNPSAKPPTCLLPAQPDLQNILLTQPVAMNDKRWDTIHFTSAALFLGSMLTQTGFTVTTGKLTMPVTQKDLELTGIHLVGLTLFEDLFKETEELLDKLSQSNYTGLLAAGGPLITLNPMAAARLLPELNILVRGESEMVFPQLLEALKKGDLESLLKQKGLLLHVPGTIVVSDLDTINLPHDFSSFRFNLDFLPPSYLGNGLEINLSRGCRRSCIFCSRVQGRHMRQLPVGVFDHLLRDFAAKLETAEMAETGGIASPTARSININDDDILQDHQYADAVFSIIRVREFKLWGVQTSVNSFFTDPDTIDDEALELVADRNLYMENNPLVWCGTDAFLTERGKRLGKQIPQEEQLLKLMQAFENHSIRHYHYWISSDFGSDWGEFLDELRLLHRMFERFPGFGLIGHAPFLVPYPSTPVYRLLERGDDKDLIKYRNHTPRHRTQQSIYQLPLVDRVETRYAHLNRLLNNEKIGGSTGGFFDLLKQKSFADLFILTYNFLKAERLATENTNPTLADTLRNHQNTLEEFIGTLL